MEERTYPYTSDDLRYLAAKIDVVLEAVGTHDLETVDDWRWGLTVTIFDDGGIPVGEIRPYGDGWLGFYPKGVPYEQEID